MPSHPAIIFFFYWLVFNVPYFLRTFSHKHIMRLYHVSPVFPFTNTLSLCFYSVSHLLSCHREMWDFIKSRVYKLEETHLSESDLICLV